MKNTWKLQAVMVYIVVALVLSLTFGLMGSTTKTVVWSSDGYFAGYRTGWDNFPIFFWPTLGIMGVLGVLAIIAYLICLWARSINELRLEEISRRYREGK